MLFTFVDVTFALSVGEYIGLFVMISFFLSKKKIIIIIIMEMGVSLAVYLSQVSGCMNLSADFCYVLCVDFSEHVGLKAASDPGVIILIVSA